jgi:3-oxoacyl-[acyl-carrier protein] reductase
MNINDAKVIITGGGSGIGKETAIVLKNAGAKVIITGRHEAKLAAAADAIGCDYIVSDASNEADVIALIPQATAIMGGFNVLINNAAYGYFAPLTDLDASQFQDLIHTNILGAMLCGREATKHFIAQAYGNIINISSTAGTAGFASGTAYVATKFALKGMTECWRQELRKHNIRVMLVNPSEVQTDFVLNSGRDPRPYNETKLQSSEIAHTILSMLSMEDRGFITEATVWATNPVG